MSIIRSATHRGICIISRSYLLEFCKFLFAALFQLGLPIVFIFAHGACQYVRHGQVSIPLVVGRHDIPGSFVSAALTERVFIGLLVVVPALARLPVAGGNLPGFILILFASQQALLLLVRADM